MHKKLGPLLKKMAAVIIKKLWRGTGYCKKGGAQSKKGGPTVKIPPLKREGVKCTPATFVVGGFFVHKKT